MFRPAVRNKLWLRMALMGPTGSGKTYTALKIMNYLVGDQNRDKIFVIDTENDSAKRYAPGPDQSPDLESGLFEFQQAGLSDYNPTKYIELIHEAEHAGALGIVIDSLSHAWAGEGGLLDQKNKLDAKGGNSYTNWAQITPQQNRLIDTIRNSPAHVIACMRTKQDIVLQQNDRGKTVPTRVGLAAVQRDDVEYEFDIIGLMDMENTMTITKSRASTIKGTWPQPGRDFAATLLPWLNTGVKLPLTKTQFIDAMRARGYDTPAMKTFVDSHPDVQGDDRWDRLLDLAAQN